MLSSLFFRISPTWYVLWPAAVGGFLWFRYRLLLRAYNRGLVQPPAYRQLRLAILACGGFMVLILLSLFYETAVLLPLVAAGLALLMALLLRSARRGLNPGLAGFHRPIPMDGLEIVVRENVAAKHFFRRRWLLWRFAQVAPLLALIAIVGSTDIRRWLVWIAAIIAMTAPVLLVAYRNNWIRPLLLLVACAVLLWQAALQRNRLPPGHWTTPWRAALCSAQVALAGDGTAWCVNWGKEQAYHYHLSTGVILEQYPVEAGWEIFAVNKEGAWIKEHPGREIELYGAPSVKMHYLTNDNDFVREFDRPASGALTDEGAFWLVDEEQRVQRFSAADEPGMLLTQKAGMLSSRGLTVDIVDMDSVWIGSDGGASRFSRMSKQWTNYDGDNGLNGTITDVALAPDGTNWLLQTRQLQSNGTVRRIWWASALAVDGSWRHYDLAAITGLSPPLRHKDTIAVDGTGRLWFAAHSDATSERYLGVLNPDGSLAHLASLGNLLESWPIGLSGLAPTLFGVLEDGEGGIYLYDGLFQPLRHWRP